MAASRLRADHSCMSERGLHAIADDLSEKADDAWDATGGQVVSAAHDLCLESWQEAATCAAVAAGTVALGAGGIAVAGGYASLAGTAGTVATWSGVVAVGAQGHIYSGTDDGKLWRWPPDARAGVRGCPAAPMRRTAARAARCFTCRTGAK